MTREQILSGIKSVLRHKLRVERTVRLDTHLVQELHLDSVQQLTLVVELENHFEICFDEGDEQGIETVADVVHLVTNRLGTSTEAIND